MYFAKYTLENVLLSSSYQEVNYSLISPMCIAAYLIPSDNSASCLTLVDRGSRIRHASVDARSQLLYTQ